MRYDDVGVELEYPTIAHHRLTESFQVLQGFAEVVMRGLEIGFDLYRTAITSNRGFEAPKGPQSIAQIAVYFRITRIDPERAAVARRRCVELPDMLQHTPHRPFRIDTVRRQRQ